MHTRIRARDVAIQPGEFLMESANRVYRLQVLNGNKRASEKMSGRARLHKAIGEQAARMARPPRPRLAIRIGESPSYPIGPMIVFAVLKMSSEKGRPQVGFRGLF